MKRKSDTRTLLRVLIWMTEPGVIYGPGPTLTDVTLTHSQVRPWLDKNHEGWVEATYWLPDKRHGTLFANN